MGGLRIIWKGALLAGICGCVQLALFLVVPEPGPGDRYLAASLDKEKLLRGNSKDRVVFVGGSNVAFGVDSYGLEKALGRYTINLGLHAGLGLRYMIAEVAAAARRGDLVVLVPEYEHFFGDTAYGSDVTPLQLLQENPGAWRFFASRQQALSLARNIGAYNLRKCHVLASLEFGELKAGLVSGVRAIIGRPSAAVVAAQEVVGAGTSPLYARSAFNARGDVVRHVGRAQPSVWIDPVVRIDDELNVDLLKEIQQTAVAFRTQGIGFCVVFPAVPRSFWRTNGDKAALVGERLKEFAANTPESSVYDDKCFFDTPYHLNGPGREIRTRQLATVLRAGCYPMSEAFLRGH